MKRKLELKKNESLNDWTVRLALYFANKKVLGEELYEVLHEVSVESYIKGSKDATNVNKYV